VTKLLDRLHQDHVHMAQLLDLLAAQLVLLRDPHADADYSLMRDIAYYFICFPDSVHHPAEDMIFGALEEKSPDLKNRFAALRAEHAEISEIGQAFHLLLEGVCSGHMVPRDKILSAAENFLNRQRRHMDTEEGEIFVIAKAYLSDESVAEFETAHGEIHDPLFGTEIRDSFKRLHAAIMEQG
jgi:hemerythrin-like domain-containing protein